LGDLHAISTFPLHTFSPQFVRYDDVFTTFHADIPDGKWFLQETLLRCAGLGASVQLSGQKLWRFRGIYHYRLIPTLRVLQSDNLYAGASNGGHSKLGAD